MTDEFVFIVQEQRGSTGVDGYRLQTYDVRDTAGVALASERVLRSSYVHADILVVDEVLIWSYRDLEAPYSGAIEMFEIDAQGTVQPVGLVPSHADGLVHDGIHLFAAARDDTSRPSGLRAYDISEPPVVSEIGFFRGRFSSVAATFRTAVAIEEGVVTCTDPLDPRVRYPCGSGIATFATGLSRSMQISGRGGGDYWQLHSPVFVSPGRVAASSGRVEVFDVTVSPPVAVGYWRELEGRSTSDLARIDGGVLLALSSNRKDGSSTLVSLRVQGSIFMPVTANDP